ncbi:hypothetical protein GCM10009839_13100 [Catenulispora yoronensis]|uniref:Uncharacterized protein n=1 Tax=Catenulispora yoronensis TaxID=450799 RepID=A0ABP5FA24_9ACTN
MERFVANPPCDGTATSFTTGRGCQILPLCPWPVASAAGADINGSAMAIAVAAAVHVAMARTRLTRRAESVDAIERQVFMRPPKIAHLTNADTPCGGSSGTVFEPWDDVDGPTSVVLSFDYDSMTSHSKIAT